MAGGVVDCAGIFRICGKLKTGYREWFAERGRDGFFFFVLQWAVQSDRLAFRNPDWGWVDKTSFVLR